MNPIAQWLFGKPRTVKGDILAALDVGSSKIACFIARTEDDGMPRVIGLGHQSSEGMRNGAVANIDALQNAVSSTVAMAEQMAGETIDRVVVNVSGAHLVSQSVGIELPLNGREVTDSDLQRITAQAQMMAPEDAHGHPLELIHTIPVGYSLDTQKGIREPVGMIGHMLGAQMHLVSAPFGAVRTLVTAIARCHLDIDRLIAAPYASGLACLVEDEMDLGCLVIDMGAGTTSFAVFFDGYVVYADGIPVGGAHVTNDIARGLTTTVTHAERLKTLYGNALSSSMDNRDMIDVPQIGEEEPENATHVPKSMLVNIIQPRLEEIFELVKAKLEKSGFQDIAGRRVVITGGASQLPGVRELAQKILDRQVRLGRPLRVARPTQNAKRARNASITGLAEATSGPAFATTAGLLAAALQNEAPTQTRFGDLIVGGTMMNRLAQWMRQSL
jgi:cell division protein FtsA